MTVSRRVSRAAGALHGLTKPQRVVGDAQRAHVLPVVGQISDRRERERNVLDLLAILQCIQGALDDLNSRPGVDDPLCAKAENADLLVNLTNRLQPYIRLSA